jgi:hypothetical protein
MIDHFLVKIDRDNKKVVMDLRRAYRNVPLNGVIRFHSQFLVTEEIANLHSHIYVQIPIQTILA